MNWWFWSASLQALLYLVSTYLLVRSHNRQVKALREAVLNKRPPGQILCVMCLKRIEAAVPASEGT